MYFLYNREFGLKSTTKVHSMALFLYKKYKITKKTNQRISHVPQIAACIHEINRLFHLHGSPFTFLGGPILVTNIFVSINEIILIKNI